MLILREILKNGLTHAPTGLLEIITNYSVLRSSTNRLLPDDLAVISKGELYQRAHETLGGDRPILFLEFGVWKGKSLRRWADINTHAESRFVGFDSFQGLPEAWRVRPAGYFSTGGQAPDLDDPRVSFVQGWFNQTLKPWLDEEFPQLPAGLTPVVHIDSDLHSSAIYLLSTLHHVWDRYHVLFDDYSAGEARALRDYLSAYNAEFIPLFGRKRRQYSRVPGQVFGEITRR
ncbi:MAG: class I SAM-dependent methyltransferase [Planctomycetota bacterium]